MAGVVQALPASRRQQPQYREERRKKVAEYLSIKLSMSGPLQPSREPQIRSNVQNNEKSGRGQHFFTQLQEGSPLTETANKTDLHRRTQVVKPLVQKMTSKENDGVRTLRKKSEDLNLNGTSKKTDSRINVPASPTSLKENQRKEAPSMTFSRTFLKTKALKEKQLKDEKVKVEPSKDVSGKPAKPMLGVYRGKVIQSKINSFRTAPSCAVHEAPVEEKLGAKAQKVATTKTSSAPIKRIAKPMATRGEEQRRPLTSKGATMHERPSASTQQRKGEQATTSKSTSSLAHGSSNGRTLPQRPDPGKNLKNGQLAQQTKVRSQKDQTGSAMSTALNPQSKSTQPLTTGKKYTRQPAESAEQIKARLAEWRASKGKVIKRPPNSVATSTTCKVVKEVPEVRNEPAIKKESVPSRTTEEPRQLFWAAMAEEDEQALLTQKVQQMFEECQKLINEDCPKEDILAILENQIQSLPEAKKVSKYWVCLACLEQREGQLEKVIAICEEAVGTGVQPLDELRSIFTDAVENLKTVTSDSGKDASQNDNPNEEPHKAEELEHQIKSQSVEQDGSCFRLKGKKEKQRKTVKLEADETLEKNPLALLETPENKENASVIRFNVRSTPHLDKIKTRIQMDESDTAFKDFKYVTPVRRSQRIERKAHNLPKMLKDHDPCVTGIAQLADLESCPSAYIFRKNQALH